MGNDRTLSKARKIAQRLAGQIEKLSDALEDLELEFAMLMKTIDKMEAKQGQISMYKSTFLSKLLMKTTTTSMSPIRLHLLSKVDANSDYSVASIAPDFRASMKERTHRNV